MELHGAVAAVQIPMAIVIDKNISSRVTHLNKKGLLPVCLPRGSLLALILPLPPVGVFMEHLKGPAVIIIEGSAVNHISGPSAILHTGRITINKGLIVS